LESQRSALAARLKSLGRQARVHRGYKRALVLINDTFRKAVLAKRRKILDAADWLIGLLEQLTVSDRKIRRVLPQSEKSKPRSPVRRILSRAS
jgi:hypothetical protein